MKYFIYIVFIFLCSSCFGQKEYTVKMNCSDSGWMQEVDCGFPHHLSQIFPKRKNVDPDSGWIRPNNEWIHVHFDTVKVMMLYVDTTASAIIPDGYQEGTTHWQDWASHWQYGYEVKVFYDLDPSIIQKDAYGNYVNNVMDKTYLDINKKPLSKNLIVWQAIEVK